METLRLAVFSAAQSVWLALRFLGRTVLGEARFDRLIGGTGLRGLKARIWLMRRSLPDGSRIFLRPQDQCIVDEVCARDIYACEGIATGQIVVDVGAHIGTFSVMAAGRVGPRGRVICFEPSPRTAELLRRNIEANCLGWVTRHPIAVADSESSAVLFVSERAEDNPAADTLSAVPGREEVSVRVRRLDDVLAEDGVSTVDHLKIDVEGAELRVMDGAPRTLAATRRLVMEVHPPRVDPAEVRRRLEALGFTCRTAFESSGGVILQAERR